MSTVALIFTVALSTVLPLAAQSSSQQQSLGDVARQLREQKSKDARKPAKVLTNDSLPAPATLETVQPAASPEASSKSTSPAVQAEREKQTESEDYKSWTREQWQAKFRAARRDLAHAKEIQQLSEDELNLLQIQQVRELDPGVKQDLDAKVQAKQSEVNVNKATTADAQKVLDDLEQNFKDSGAPEDWSVTDEPAHPTS